jgi:hypothetical protein
MSHDQGMQLACVTQAQYGGAPTWLRIRWGVKDRWKGREGTPTRLDDAGDAGDGEEQLMLAVSGNQDGLWLSGWLFDEPVLKPTSKTCDLLDTRTWDWVRGALVWRDSVCVEDARVEFADTIPPALLALAKELPSFCRLRGDRQLLFGDGGETWLAFPLLFARDLGLSPARRSQLVQGLLALAKRTGDYQPKQKHVQDIIDPDLCPQLIPDWKQRRATELQARMKTMPSNYYGECV